MKKMQCQVQPGNEKEPQRSFGRRATAPRQEERGLPLPFIHVNSLGQSAGSPSDPRVRVKFWRGVDGRVLGRGIFSRWSCGAKGGWPVVAWGRL